MKTIKKLTDITKLRRSETLDKAYLDYLESYFLQLYEALGDNVDLDVFTLEPYGYFVLLEKGDNIRSLQGVGLPTSGGLLEVFPEYVEKEILTEYKQIWRIGVLYDNEYLQSFFAPVGELGSKAEAWLSERELETQLFTGELRQQPAAAKEW